MVTAQVLAVPLLLWLASYIYLAFHFRCWNLLYVKVHESGRLTFLQTVFYFNHFLRELPVLVMYMLALDWTYRVMAPSLAAGRLAGRSGLLLSLVVGFVLVAIMGSVRTVGLRNTVLDLLQFRDRDASVGWGSHWQMHFLSTFAMMLILMAPGTLVEHQEHRLAGWIVFAFFTLSILLGTGLRAVTDRRWLLHGGREIITFFGLAVLPGLAAIVGTVAPDALKISNEFLIVVSAVAVTGAYYLRVLATTSIRETAEGDHSPAYLIASHFFEHVLDFVFMVLLMLFLLSCH